MTTFSLTSATSPVGVQTSYAEAMAVGHVGMLADSSEYTAITGINETDAVLPFGVVVVTDGAGTSGDAVKMVASNSTLALGVTIDSFTFETTKDANGRPGYPDQATVNVLTEGTILVYSEEAVAVGDEVHVRHTTASTNYAGYVRKTAVSGKTSLLANAKFASKTSGAGLAAITIDGPTLTLTADT
jgi:hypothetical protein